MKLRYAAALAAILAFAGVYQAALALPPPDATRTPVVRLHSTQQVSYYRAVVNYSDSGISSAVQFGTFPSNAFIVDVKVEIITAFNAGTTNVLTFGTTTTATNIVNSGDVDETATGVTAVTRGLGRSLTASGDTSLYAKYTQSGTAATAGKAVVVISYIADNDL